MSTNKTRFKNRDCETAPIYIVSNKVPQNTTLTLHCAQSVKIAHKVHTVLPYSSSASSNSGLYPSWELKE